MDWATPQLYECADARLFDFDEEADERETGVPTVRWMTTSPRPWGGPDFYGPRGGHDRCGDLVEGDKIIHGDEVLGDKISIGSISGSSAAIGSGARSGLAAR